MSDDVAVGRMVRDLRVTRNLRQVDVAARAGVSREAVSRLERGLIDGLTVSTLRAISRALEMPPIAILGWRSPELERLRDRTHAAMVESFARLLVRHGWQLAPEMSFNHYGERGSADILAWHPERRALLIVEIKTRLWDLQDTLSTLDRKRRVLPAAIRDQLGWEARALGVVLVLPELSTHRHVVARHEITFGTALPQRQLEVRNWLREPNGRMRGLLFLPISHLGDIGRRSLRKRARRAPAKPSPPALPRSPGAATTRRPPQNESRHSSTGA